MVPGLLWFVPWWIYHCRHWDWKEQLPWLLLVSVLTTAYGGWPFDLVLLLVPVVHVAVRLQGIEAGRWRAVALGGHVLVGLLAAVQLALGVEYFWFIWMCPTLLAAYGGIWLCHAKPQAAIVTVHTPLTKGAWG